MSFKNFFLVLRVDIDRSLTDFRKHHFFWNKLMHFKYSLHHPYPFCVIGGEREREKEQREKKCQKKILFGDITYPKPGQCEKHILKKVGVIHPSYICIHYVLIVSDVLKRREKNE